MTPITMPALRFSPTRCLMRARMSASDAITLECAAVAEVPVCCWAYRLGMATAPPRRATSVRRTTDMISPSSGRYCYLRFDLREKAHYFLPLRAQGASHGSPIERNDH